MYPALRKLGLRKNQSYYIFFDFYLHGLMILLKFATIF